jgi:very-long-chain enoyl-CoA reductase
MSINFSVKSGKKFYDIPLTGAATVKDLKVAFAQISKKDINRISFKAGSTRLDDDSKSLVTDYKLSQGGEITFKDLGPQIGYRTVFLGKFVLNKSRILTIK